MSTGADGVRGFRDAFQIKSFRKTLAWQGYKQMLAAGGRVWYTVSQGSQRSDLRVKPNKAGGRGEASRSSKWRKVKSWPFSICWKRWRRSIPSQERALPHSQQQRSSIISLYHSCVPPFVRDSRDRKQFWPQWKRCFWKANKYGLRWDYFFPDKNMQLGKWLHYLSFCDEIWHAVTRGLGRAG